MAMWFLLGDGGHIIFVTPKNDAVQIGRNLDLRDMSISRKHAVLNLSDGNLLLTDLGSKFGTTVNNSDIPSNIPVTLDDNYDVKFGNNNKWKVHKVKFVTCTSTLKGENLIRLESILNELGGCLKTSWESECNYLTMPAITLTIKVVLALIQGVHIVTLSYWNKCREAVFKGIPLPDPKQYQPAIVESTLNKDSISFSPDPRRANIFEGKKFVFLSKRQMEMYKDVILFGSGTPMLLSESKMTKLMLSSPEVVVIQFVITTTSQESQNVKNQINTMVTYLKSKGRRLVADAEIGLAVLYCSLEKYCNPLYNFSSSVLKEAEDSQSVQVNKPVVLAQESQDRQDTNKPTKNVILEETLSLKIDDYSENNMNGEPGTTSKRKLSENSNETVESVSKKLATESSVRTNNDSEDIMFNFINPGPSEENVEKQSEVVQNKLNFLKPLKRKPDYTADDDDDLFNFIPGEDTKELKQSHMFSASTVTEETVHKNKKQKITDDSVNDSEIKDTKEFKPLQYVENNTSWKSRLDTVNIKKEQSLDNCEDINELVLGVTVIVLNDDLLRKDDPVIISTNQEDKNVVNFKKFKKIWPIHRQDTVIHISTMSTVKTDGSVIGDIPMSDDEDLVDPPHMQKKTNIKQFFKVK